MRFVRAHSQTCARHHAIIAAAGQCEINGLHACSKRYLAVQVNFLEAAAGAMGRSSRIAQKTAERAGRRDLANRARPAFEEILTNGRLWMYVLFESPIGKHCRRRGGSSFTPVLSREKNPCKRPENFRFNALLSRPRTSL